MHSNSDNIEVMAYDDANESIKGLFESCFSRYQISLETTMRGSDFIFGCVNLIYYKWHKIRFKRGRSLIEIDSLDWLKKKKATINPKYYDDRYFQHVATIVHDFEEIK